MFSDILFWHPIWRSIWHLFWHPIWHLSGIYSDILSGILSDILFRHSILHLFWHSLWHEHCQLRSGARGWGPAVPTAPTEIWRSSVGYAVQDRSGWEYSLRTQHGAPNRLASSAKHHCMANFKDTLQTIYSTYMYSFSLVTLYLLYIIMTVLSWLMLVTKSIYPHLTSKLCRIRGRRASGYFTCRPSEQCQMMAKHRKTIGK